MRSGSAARVAPHFNHGRQNRNKDMNRNTDSRTRIECTDWDEEVPVATWAKGCGRPREPACKQCADRSR